MQGAGAGTHTGEGSISSPRRATAGIQLSIGRGLGPLFGLNAVWTVCGPTGCAVTCAAHDQARGRAPAIYIFAHHGSQADRTRTSRAGPGGSRLCRRRARVEGDGQGVERQTGEPDGKPLSWLGRRPGPARAPRPARGIAATGWADLAHVNDQVRVRARASSDDRRPGRARGRGRGPGR